MATCRPLNPPAGVEPDPICVHTTGLAVMSFVVYRPELVTAAYWLGPNWATKSGKLNCEFPCWPALGGAAVIATTLRNPGSVRLKAKGPEKVYRARVWSA